MSSRVLMAAVTAIALSTPAWADDPAEAPIDTEMKALLFDPAEAPIDTEMKALLFVENILAPLQEGIGGGAPVATGQQAELQAPPQPALAELAD